MSDQTSEPRGPRGTEHPGIPAGHPIRPTQHPDLAPKAKPKQALPQVMPPASMLRGGGGRR